MYMMYITDSLCVYIYILYNLKRKGQGGCSQDPIPLLALPILLDYILKIIRKTLYWIRSLNHVNLECKWNPLFLLRVNNLFKFIELESDFYLTSEFLHIIVFTKIIYFVTLKKKVPTCFCRK